MLVTNRIGYPAARSGQILLNLVWMSLAGVAWSDDWTISGSNTTVASGTRVGIGISNPTSNLEVNMLRLGVGGEVVGAPGVLTIENEEVRVSSTMIVAGNLKAGTVVVNA